MTRRSMFLRSLMIVFAMMSLTTVFSQIARAQDDCKCDYGTIAVGADVKCKFDVCVKTTSTYNCYTVGPGSTIKFKCDGTASIFLTDCKGNLVQVTTKCVTCVCVGEGCFVDACLGRDKNGCLVVKIGASAKC